MAQSKKSKKPAPPKPTRMDIILDPHRQEILKKLEETTGLKTNTKILFHCAEFYLSDKVRMQTQIREQSAEISSLRRELVNAREHMSHFLSAFRSMEKFCFQTEAGQEQKADSVYSFCDNCGHRCNADDIEEGECPKCGEII